MISYIVKRVSLGLLTIFLVSTLTFFLMNLVPGGPFLAEKAISPEAQAALEAKFGLDKPLSEQYFTYMSDLLDGDMGPSIKQRGRDVNGIISSKFPVSAKLGGLAVTVALCLGIPLGSIAAVNRGKWVDSLIIVVATFGIAVPGFVLCTVLLYIFSVQLGVLPSYGLETPLHYIMPIMALSFYPTAYITRLMRTSMLDVLGQDYMRTAKAKGLSQMISLFKHALRNSILPIVTYLGPLLAYILVGSFVTEEIFTIPGLGSELIGAITSRDYPLIMGITIFLSVLMISLNVLVDIAYKFIDPRIKLK